MAFSRQASHTQPAFFASVTDMIKLILLVLALVLFLVSGVLYLRPEPSGLAGALLAFGAAAFVGATLAD